MKKSTLWAFLMLLGGTGANAATVSTYTIARATVNPVLVNVDPSAVDDTDIGGGDTTASSSYSSNSNASVASTSTSSSLFADGDTGVIRASSSASGVRGDGFGDGNTNAQGSIRETYTLSGSGTFTASIRLSGVWDVSRINLQPGQPDPDPFWQVQSSVSIDGNSSNSLRDAVCIGTACGPSINQSDSGSITDYILTVSRDYFIASGTRIATVDFSLLTQLASATNGLIDFGNTAELLVETTGSLFASPSDPDFLSDPAFNGGGGNGNGEGGNGGGDPSVVPLPASSLLLLCGLTGLAFLRRRKEA